MTIDLWIDSVFMQTFKVTPEKKKILIHKIEEKITAILISWNQDIEIRKAKLINDNFGKMTSPLILVRASEKTKVYLHYCLPHTFVTKFFFDFQWRPNKVYINFAISSLLTKTVAKKILTLSVEKGIWYPHLLRRGGGGLANPPIISKNVDSITFNFGRQLRTIDQRQKTCGVDDLSLVRLPWQLSYLWIFLTKFC